MEGTIGSSQHLYLEDVERRPSMENAFQMAGSRFLRQSLPTSLHSLSDVSRSDQRVIPQESIPYLLFFYFILFFCIFLFQSFIAAFLESKSAPVCSLFHFIRLFQILLLSQSYYLSGGCNNLSYWSKNQQHRELDHFYSNSQNRKLFDYRMVLQHCINVT